MKAFALDTWLALVRTLLKSQRLLYGPTVSVLSASWPDLLWVHHCYNWRIRCYSIENRVGINLCPPLSDFELYRQVCHQAETDFRLLSSSYRFSH